MDQLTERVRVALRRTCTPETRLLLAVSGGADSVALAELVSRSGWPISKVVFVDHGLRDVALERQASRAVAERIAAPWCEIALSLHPGGNLQARARTARYGALLELARHDKTVLATGHTSTDQAETVMSRLLRGSGVRGLAGLQPRQGLVVRPLLAVSRDETRSLGFPFADDPSNVERRFTRNRLRAELLPLLARENPRIVENLCALSDSARGTTALVSALLMELARAERHPHDLGLGAEALSALLHHIASEAGASPTREALALWTSASNTRRPTRVSLGDGLVGVVGADGGLRVETTTDPRQVTTVTGPGRFDTFGLLFQVDNRQTPGAMRLDGPGPWSVVPLPGARAAQRGLVELDQPVLAVLDATGRTLGRARADGSWATDTLPLVAPLDLGGSPPPLAEVTASVCFYVTIKTSDGAPKSEVVAPPEGPLTSGHANDGASPQMGGTEGLPNRGCAPTETKSSSRIDGREG